MGLTINKLYCICVDKLETSFFKIQDDCQKKEMSCCKKSSKSCCSKNSNKEKPCTEKDATFYKLDTEFDTPDNSYLALLAPVTVLPILSIPNAIKKQPLNEALFYTDNSPPLFLLHSVFRC
jgi:hypothetical protein